MPRLNRDPRTARKASVLVAVLVVISLLSLAAYQYSDMMQQENVAAHSALKLTQARALADSGIHYAAAILADTNSMSGINNNPYDAESSFKSIQLGGDVKGRFSVVSAIPHDEITSTQKFRYGVSDESGKININALVAADPQKAHDVLMKLQDMTDEIADSIVNWIQPASKTPRPSGATSDYYASQQPSYRCKNAPLDTIEELLLVRGVTPALLFGTDYNRNGIEDSGEDGGNGFDPGWAASLTVYSRSRNVDADGNPRINVNDTISQDYYDNINKALGKAAADYLVLYHANAGSQPAPQGASNVDDIVKAVIAKPPQSTTSITSIFSLLSAAAVNIQSMEMMGNRITIRQIRVSNPFADTSQQATLLPTLLDKLTTKSGTELPPRVNFLTAPKSVLTCMTAYGNLTDADVETILEARPDLSSGNLNDEIYKTPAWLLVEAKLPVAGLIALDNAGVLGSRTQVYRVQSVGTLDDGGPSARVEAVIDTNDGKPRIVMWRDLSELGKGYNLDQ